MVLRIADKRHSPHLLLQSMLLIQELVNLWAVSKELVFKSIKMRVVYLRSTSLSQRRQSRSDSTTEREPLSL